MSSEDKTKQNTGFRVSGNREQAKIVVRIQKAKEQKKGKEKST